MMKMKLFAQATWVKLTTKNFEKLDDFNLIYNKKLLPIPYVSITYYNQFVLFKTFFLRKYLKITADLRTSYNLPGIASINSK